MLLFLQIMYMYYLLGYRIVRMCQKTIMEAMDADNLNALRGWRAAQSQNTGIAAKSQIFQLFDEEVIAKVLYVH
jgi:hypothetical protein